MAEKKNKMLAPVYTLADINKSGKQILNKEQIQMIVGSTPKNQIYERPAKGGGKWSYVKGSYVKKMLNMVFGWDWDFEVVEYKFDLQIKQAFVLGKLTVRLGDKEKMTLTKMQFGRVDIKFKTVWDKELGKKVPTDEPLDIGNDLKAATTDALKKCASELGIASDIYADNEFKEIYLIEDTVEDKAEIIKEMLEIEGLRLPEDERMNIERILDENEEESYDKAIRVLNFAMPKTKKE